MRYWFCPIRLIHLIGQNVFILYKKLEWTPSFKINTPWETDSPKLLKSTENLENLKVYSF